MLNTLGLIARPRTVAALAAAGALLLPAGAAAGQRAGSLDRTFGTGGRVVTSFPGAGQGTTGANALALQRNGRLVAAGTQSTSNGGLFAVARYLPNGRLDTSFSGDGRVTTAFPAGAAGGQGVVVTSTGRIIVGGSAGPLFALAAYTPSGRLDTTFGTGGRVTVPFPQAAGGRALALDSSGRLVLSGDVGTPQGTSQFAVARFTPSGRLDRSFGGDGTVVTPLGTAGDVGLANGVTTYRDGRVLVAGPLNNPFTGGGAFALVRYRPNGSLDPTFSGDGKVTTVLGAEAGPNAVVLAGSRIIAFGDAVLSPGASPFVLAGYRANGSLDATFGRAGITSTPWPPQNVAQGQALAIDPRGRLVGVGEISTSPSTSAFGLARYRANGLIDTSFGRGGRVTTTFSSPASDSASAVVTLPDGRIVAAGAATRGFALARYLGTARVPVTGRAGAR